MRVILWCLQYSETHYSDIATTGRRTNTYIRCSTKSSSKSLSTSELGGGSADEGVTVQSSRPIVEACCRGDVFGARKLQVEHNTDAVH
jgi:hypothetical protein